MLAFLAFHSSFIDSTCTQTMYDLEQDFPEMFFFFDDGLASYLCEDNYQAELA